MFRHGWPHRSRENSAFATASRSDSEVPNLQNSWNAVCRGMQNVAAGANDTRRHVLGEVLNAMQRLQFNRQTTARCSRAPAFACLSSTALDKGEIGSQTKQNSIRVQSESSILPQVTADGSRNVNGSSAKGKDADMQPADERILISEVEIRGVEGDLKKVAEQALSLKPNFAYTAEEVRGEVQRIFDTGFFSLANPKPEDTRDGIKLIVQLEANDELRGVVSSGANVLPQAVVQETFKNQHGRPLNFKDFRASVKQINEWYDDRGIFGQVTDVSMEDGIVDLKVAEMEVNNVTLRFINKKTGESKEEGATRPEVIMRHLATRPGQVYNMQQASRDIDNVYSMGLFDDVNILPQPVEDANPDHPKVDLTLNLVERKTGGLSAGGGISAQGHSEGALPGVVGSFSYSERNLFGLNQKLNATVELGQVDSLFRISHTDPWIRGDVHRTSRTINFQNTRTSGNAIHGRVPEEQPAHQTDSSAPAEDGADNVIVSRLLGGVEYARPLGAGWAGTLGVNWQQAGCIDEHGTSLREDVYGSPLTFTGGAHDTMATALLRGVYTGRTASGSDTQAVVSMEQALPLRSEWLNFNRFQARAEHTVPLGRYRLLLCGKGGMIVGDLPPYEAFPIGGTNSVRGYSEGGVGSARAYAGGTAEFHFPLLRPVQGTLFADYGSDMNSGVTVTGDPAGARGKPGNGYGYGAGIRVDSPVGPLRLEYAFNQQGFRRFHLGIGSH